MFLKAKENLMSFAAKHPNAIAPMMAVAMAVASSGTQVLGFAEDETKPASTAKFDPDAALETIVGWVTTIVLAVGLVYVLIAGMNFFSAIKNEDSERQSKAVMNIFIGLGLCLIKPIVVILLKAVGGEGNDAVTKFGGGN